MLEMDPMSINREITLLNIAEHEHIVQLYDVYETETKVYLVLELLKGGDVSQLLEIEDNEEEVKYVVKEILKGLMRIHELGAMHRDIKPENIIYTDSVGGNLKLIDFGLASLINEPAMRSRVGTSDYQAPAMFTNKTYDSQVDLWSLGALVYYLLSGVKPFYNDNHMITSLNIQKAKYDFRPKKWKKVSVAGKHFVKSLLTKNPEERLTAKKARKHPWLKD
eukprot:TRINITY_DN3515_c0_g1_i1.p1 TRINITY_DN3515_c0_g1~~TRINITY_DN3515_c0_g1_i1.p1  ORF type:complete len:221 (+),score=50.38 TRINITY_DN3515_c0_g1_i1:472-1134(+)